MEHLPVSLVAAFFELTDNREGVERSVFHFLFLCNRGPHVDTQHRLFYQETAACTLPESSQEAQPATTGIVLQQQLCG